MIKRIFSVFILISLLLTACSAAVAAKAVNIADVSYYTDIPEITQEEILAIEALKASRESFSYGVLYGTELFVRSDGSYVGFTRSFCELLTGLFGIEFKLELFYEWDILMKKYDEAEIDFIGELCSMPERMEIYRMTGPIAEHALRLYTRTDAPEITSESEISGLRIGFLANTVTASYIQNAYPALVFDVVDVDNYEDAAEMLLSGEIDAFVEDADSDIFFINYDELRSKKLFPLVYSPISMSTANDEFAPIISAVDKYLTAGGIDTLLEMYHDGELEYSKYKLDKQLTDEEKAYLENALTNPVKLALENDNYPLSFYNQEEGEYQGIAVDILNEISEILGISFEIVTDETTHWMEMLDMLKTEDADIISQLLYTEGREESYLWSDTPYCKASYALLSKIEYPDLTYSQVFKATVGTVANTAHELVFLKWFPDHTKIKRYKNKADAAKALENGEIDLYMASEHIMLSQTNYYENSGLKINILLSETLESRFGFDKNTEVLCSIINKVQPSVDTESIVNDWTGRNFDYQKKAATERVNYFMAFSIALVLFVILILYLYLKNKRLNNNLAELVEERTHELERKSATLTAIYESMPDLLFSLDTDLKYISGNPGFERLAGRPQAEIIGKSARDLFSDSEMAEFFSHANQEVLKSGKTNVTERLVSYPDGTQELIETVRTPLFQDGELAGILGIGRNISARKAADERAKIMLDATPLCCCLVDADYNIIDCNEEAVKLYNLRDRREYQDKFYELSPELQPDGQRSVEKAKECIREAFERGSMVFEWMHQTLDGTPIPGEITLVRVKRGNENIVAGYTRDLREQNKMLRELEHKDYLLHTVNNMASLLLRSEPEEFESSLWQCMGLIAEPVGADRVYIWKNYTRDGKLYCTQIFEWSEGASPMQGMDLAAEASYDDLAIGWEEKLSGGNCINSPIRDLSPEEQSVLVPQGILSILVVPVFLRDEFWGFVGFDDCHRERVFSNDEVIVLLSASLLIAYSMLRNEMTLDIRAAVEKAEAASLAKGNFLANMSHEIRTPLNAITGMTTIGQLASDVEKKDYALGKIEDASNHLLGVINDILDMSKIEANKFELSDVEFNFEKMLQKVVNVIHFRIDEKKQQFSVNLDKDIPQTLIGDNQRLAQIITNLLSNAVKFTPEGNSIRLDAGLEGEENDICTLQIAVTDTGIGINPEELARLFEPFEQAERNISRKFGGTGLGLSISKHIVELMNGRIWAESEPGKGSKFAFTVQMQRGTETAIAPIGYGTNHEIVRVLAVDDEPETRAYFAGIGERLGVVCDTADCGEKALRMIDSGSLYDVFFIDRKLPGMDGVELAREIRARFPDSTGIVMISAFDWTPIEQEALDIGVRKFIPKPLFISEIADCINECIGINVNVNPKENLYKGVSFHGRRLLLAEDVEINRDIVTTLLEPTGIEIDCAENGAQALKAFSESPERYDMILMDVHMPELDGLEATRRIRSLGFAKAAEIPIIAMTANVFREDVELCKSVGMNDHLGKPLDLSEMLNKMKQWMK